MPVTTTYSVQYVSGFGTHSLSQTAGVQKAETIVSTGDGKTVVFYFDAVGSEIAARTISATGEIGARVAASSGSVFIGTTADGSNEPVSAAVLSNGNIVLTWASNEPTKNIYFRIFDADLNPLTGATLAETTTTTGFRPDVAALADGGFVIVWENQFSATDSDVTYRRFTSNGTGVDSSSGIALDASINSIDEAPSVAGLADGGFAVAWSRRDSVSGDTDVWTAVRNADGSVRAAAALQDTQGVINRDVEVVARSDGGFSVIYEDSGWTTSAADTEITVANYTAAGGFNGYVRGNNDGPDTVMDSSAAASISPEGFIGVAFNRAAGFGGELVSFSLLGPSGQLLTDADGETLDTDVYAMSVSSLTWLDGSMFRVVYESERPLAPDTDSGITTRVFSIYRSSQGDAGNNTIDYSASSVGNSMYGFDGNDVLIGGAKRDDLLGGNHDDTLIGNGGDDLLMGELGQNSLWGGTGNDTYWVMSASDVIHENPGEGDNDAVFASVSVYLHPNVERLAFNGTGNFYGVGNDQDNRIDGTEGENLLIGGGGNDTINGRNARDSIFGETGDDTLNGDAGVDYIVGGSGNDTINGGDDPDEIYGQEGNDILNGGNTFHTDIIVGGDGDDQINGSSGLGDYDRLYGNLGNDTFFVDTPDDLVFEQAGEGTDTVYADIVGAGFYLYDDIENLILLDITPFGVGNALGNTLVGNAVGNYLLGGDGNDHLNGGLGNDVLFGQTGNDIFDFDMGTGGDVIGDFVQGQDKIDVSAYGMTFEQLQTRFVQNGNVGAIQMTNGDVIVLHNVTMGQLTASDFILPPSGEAPAAAKAAPVMVAPTLLAEVAFDHHVGGGWEGFDLATMALV